MRLGGRANRREMIPWSPLMVAPCMLWLRADMGITLGTGVAAWADMSGQGNTVAQSFLSLQPSLLASSINGLPAVQGNGTTQYLVTPGNLSSVPNSFFAVAKATTQAGTRCVHGDVPGTYNLLLQTATQIEYNTNATTIPVTVTTTNPHVYACVINGSSSVTFVDGAKTTGTMSQGAPANAPLAVCQSGSAYWDGPISEILMYSGILTAGQVSTIGRYLAARYNIAGTW